MKDLTGLLLVFVVGVIALGLGGYVGYQQYRAHAVPAVPTAALSDLELPDVDAQLRNGREWHGKVVVVNHWAPWCPPCRKEIPLLIAYQQQMAARGVQVVGVSHDTLNATRIFAAEIGLNYPSLLATVGGGEIMQQHGNTSASLPFTAIFDRQGQLVSSHLGLMTWQELDAQVLPLL